MQVLIAHAEGEEQIAEQIAQPLRAAGYDVSHRGTVLVGESILEEASKTLQCGAPVVLCGTVRALGTGWAHRLVNAAHSHPEVRVYPLQVEPEAYLQVLAADEQALPYWQDPAGAITRLLAALACHYPSSGAATGNANALRAERRYRSLALEACDIIDLANLPEMDRNVATRELELRRLYVALRVSVGNADLAGGEETGSAPVVTAPDPKYQPVEGPQSPPTAAVAVGERLSAARRLVVLGDPGAGKTTLLRWIATAYLLRLKDDPSLGHLPDVATLPPEDWLPVMVRCRELSPATITGSLDDILLATLKKTELAATDAEAMGDLLRAKLEAGEVLLLVDGLDEITEAAARARFCRKLEGICLAYPQVPVIATSRVVGYREMGYRIGRGFEHVTVADLSRSDKDDFARRWCAVTEPKERCATATRELIRDIHSMDRIERLTGNPMLLTTMALIKRKVGKLPSRRADLYWDAVEVLLNWRGEVDAPIDHREAIPQLEYIAYTMCQRGVQQLREDEILQLLEQMRGEYPKVHAIHARPVDEFIHDLERRTGILSESGYVRHRGRPVAVFEFRHLTFQEYLAGLALVDGRHPDRDHLQSLAERVAPLASMDFGHASTDGVVVDAWREALRLCVTSCNDDDVDDVLRAILSPLPGEASRAQLAHRRTLAAQCLADEPNASLHVANEILASFIATVGSSEISGIGDSPVEHSAFELLASRWGRQLRRMLIDAFVACAIDEMPAYGSMRLRGNEFENLRGPAARGRWLAARTRELESGRDARKCDAALRVMWTLFINQGMSATEVAAEGVMAQTTGALVDMLDGALPCQFSAACALRWLVGNRDQSGYPLMGPRWDLPAPLAAQVVTYLSRGQQDSVIVSSLFSTLIGYQDTSAVDTVASYLSHPALWVSKAAAEVLSQMHSPAVWPVLCGVVEAGDRYSGGVTSVALEGLAESSGRWRGRAITAALASRDPSVRTVALALFARKLSAYKRALLSRDLDGVQPFLDPAKKISEKRVKRAAAKTGKSEELVRSTYEELAGGVGLKLAWQQGTTKPASGRTRPPGGRR